MHILPKLRSSDITAQDFFCGAGGSSTGIKKAGVRVAHAANHSELAIKTHQTNHPTTDHSICELQETHPAHFPWANIAWFSPECTNHSIAKGRKRKNLGQLDLWGEHRIDPDEERSRATMREVVEFTEYHRYDIVIVENVVDIKQWQHYDAWLTEMMNLGYDHKTLYLNAQFFGVPQSRDRIYIVFWKRGNKTPDLDFRFPAYCPKHGPVQAVQSWKKPTNPWGRYGDRRQYIYCCPQCGTKVEPAHTPAATIIDWSIPSEKIGDRSKPLKPKTMARIKAGLEKFKDKAVLVDTTFDGNERRVRDVDDPMPSQTSRATLYLLEPFIAALRNHGQPHTLQDALAAITAGGMHHGLVTPPFLAILKGDLTGITTDQPLSTVVASASQHWLVTPPMLLSNANQESPARPVNEALYTVATQFTQQLVVPPFLTQYYTRDDAQSGLDQALPTVPTEPRHALVVPPMLTSVNDWDNRNISVDQPMGTMTTQNKFALTTPPVIMTYNGEAVYAPVHSALPAITTIQRHALLTPDEMLMECGFRMLEPHELKLGMSFPNDYVILGNKRQQVKQIGNAVACNVAEALIERCAATLR